MGGASSICKQYGSSRHYIGEVILFISIIMLSIGDSSEWTGLLLKTENSSNKVNW